jgi:predicted nucleic acid-binding protein
VKDFVLDASLALRWCFQDEATEATESLLTLLQNQEALAWVPGIWQHEVLNGLGKGITRGRVDRQRAFLLWQEIRELPLRIVEIPIDRKLLELALEHNLAVYHACYLSLGMTHRLAIATLDGKLQLATKKAGLDIIAP